MATWQLLGWMLLPYGIVALGLYGLGDYRLTVYLYSGICCVLPLLLYRHRPPYWPLAINPAVLALTMVSSLVLMLWLWDVLTPVFIDWPFFQAQLTRIHLTSERFFWGDALYFVLINPLVEESFWRGLVYEQLRQRLSDSRALVVSSIFFGAWHWMVIQYTFGPLWAVPLSMLVMVGGIIFALTYRRTGTLLAPILVHASGDFAIILMLLQALRHTVH